MGSETTEKTVIIACMVVIPSCTLEVEEILACVELDCLRSKVVRRQRYPRRIIGSALQHSPLLINNRPGAPKIITHIITVRQRPRGSDVGVPRIMIHPPRRAADFKRPDIFTQIGVVPSLLTHNRVPLGIHRGGYPDILFSRCRLRLPSIGTVIPSQIRTIGKSHPLGQIQERMICNRRNGTGVITGDISVGVISHGVGVNAREKPRSQPRRFIITRIIYRRYPIPVI